MGLLGVLLVYLELFGKGGLYGVGYEHDITPTLSLGGAASYIVVRDQELTTASPYVHARVRKHLYVELGAVLEHSAIRSKVADWDGMSATGSGGFASVGYEGTVRKVVVRASGSAMVGAGGASPWVGLSFGWRP